MSRSLQLIPASSLGLAELADLYTRSFADYFYDVSVTTEELARRVPAELIDLDRSLLASVDGTIAGIALLCLEGEGACCGGFGVTVPFRGQGLATPLAMAMFDQARTAGARRLTLVVMAENERAVRSYARAGMQIWRDLITLAWQRPSGWIAPEPVEGIVELPPYSSSALPRHSMPAPRSGRDQQQRCGAVLIWLGWHCAMLTRSWPMPSIGLMGEVRSNWRILVR